MKIHSFHAKGLHGFLDIDVDFNSDLTVIVGKNGSGKTSALNIIADLLRLDIPALRRTPFRRVELRLSDSQKRRVTLTAENTDEEKSVRIQLGDSVDARVPLDLPQEFFSQRDSVTVSNGLRHWQSLILQLPYPLEPETSKTDIKEWLEASRRFCDETKLTFVRLDRTIVAVDPDGNERIEASNRSRAPRNSGNDPMDEILRVTTKKYGEYKNQLEAIKNDAFNNLLQLHFDPLEEVSPKAKTTTSQLKTKLQQLRRRVEESTLLADAPHLKASTKSFFDSFSKLLFSPSTEIKPRAGRKSLQEEAAQILLNVKERQLERLLEIFDQEQEQAQAAYDPIKRYLDATGKFLEESGKRLSFDASLQLGFTVPSLDAWNKSEASKLRNPKELASGERQILIVLTYLAFMAGENSIFIVDEPELSLHLQWQGYLIDALKDLRPKNAQIIIATHAPEIAGRARSKVKFLRPNYLVKSSEEQQ